MKLGLTFSICLFVFFTTSLVAQIHQAHEHVLFINYSSTCMKKLDYRVDHGFIIDDNHTAYHINLDAQRTLILRVLSDDHAIQELPSKYAQIFDCQSLKDIDESFVVGVNSGTTNVYLLEGDAPNVQYYQVSFAEYNVENNLYFSSFAPPLHSFVYEFGESYDPLQPLHPVAFDAFDYNTRTFYFGSEHEKAQNKHVFLSVYRDVCAHRPFSLTTPRTNKGEDNPYKFQDITEDTAETPVLTNSTKKILRSCQHPVQMIYLKGVGLIGKSYEEDGKTYQSNLVRIDGSSLEEYLSNKPIKVANYLSPEKPIYWEYKPQKPASTTLPTSTDIAFKSSEKTSKLFDKNIGADFSPISSNEPGRSPAIQQIPEYIAHQAKKEFFKTQDVLIHVVKKGDTVYSISKKYNMSIKNVKALNKLNSNTITIGQELFVNGER